VGEAHQLSQELAPVLAPEPQETQLALTGRPRPEPRPYSHPHPFRMWVTSFAVIWLAMAAWSFASPLGSAPDEPAHLIRAASVVRGQLLGEPVPHPSPMTRGTVTVEVPQIFARLANDVGCFQFKPQVPASCQGSLAGSRSDVGVYTYVGRYPPLYYGLVGLPTLVLVSPGGMYGARLVSAALSAAMLALSLLSLRRCRGAPLLGAGLALAVTPMALYLGGVVNPSGLEISSAISAWMAAMALVAEVTGERQVSGGRGNGSEPGEEIPAGQLLDSAVASNSAAGPPNAISSSNVAALGISAIVLILCRGLSPVWAAFIGLALVVLLGRKWRDLLRQHAVKGWLGGCVAALVAAGVWDLIADPFLTEPGAPVPPGTSTSQLFMLALERLDLIVTSTIGQFGWLDTPSPYAVVLAWVAALGAVFFLAVCVARRREVLVAVAAVLAWVVVPLAIILSQGRSEGILGQGRDFMALGVGIPLIASSIAGQRLGGRAASLRLGALIVIVLGVCQLADFYGALRRNTVGTAGPINAFSSARNSWHPAIPAVALFIVFVLAVAALCQLISRAAHAQAAAPANEA